MANIQHVNTENPADDLKTGAKKINDNFDSVNADLTSQDSRINNIVGQSGSSNTEIVDARKNNRGKVYDVLKDRLDEVDTDLKERAANVKWYGASGSDQTTTGSINTGSNVLTVPNIIDFKVGQGIAIDAAGPNSLKEAASLQITTAATASGNVTVTLDGVATTIAVVAGDSAITIADKIRNSAFSGWTTGGTTGTDTVTITADAYGDKQDATYDPGTTGAIGTMTTTTQGVNDVLFSTITDIPGTTINLADAASTTVSNVTVSHDDTEAFASFHSQMTNGMIPSGSYQVPGSIGNPSSIGIVKSESGATINGKNIPFFSISKENAKTLPQNYFFISQDTTDRNDATTFQLQRNVNTDDSITNPKAFRAVSNVNIDTAQTEWAISGEMNNYSNIDSAGNVAVSGVSQKFGKAAVFGGHFQAKDFNTYAAATDVTALIGAEINTPAIGLDHPTANHGYGNRIGMHLIAVTNKDADPNAAEAEIGSAIMINTDNPTRSNGYFRYGMVVTESTGNPNPIGTAILINTSGNYGIGMYGANKSAHFYSSGAAAFGAIFDGDYTSGTAIRVAADKAIAFEGTNAVQMKYNSTTGYLEFYKGGSRKGYIDLTASGSDHAL